MSAHRLINIALTAALVVAVATILSTGHLLDDHSADWHQSTALADAQKAAQIAARTERAAAQLCVRIKGPNAGYRWTASGELVCTSNKARAPCRWRRWLCDLPPGPEFSAGSAWRRALFGDDTRRRAPHGKELQCTARNGTAKQRGLRTRGARLPGRFDPNATKRIAYQCKANRRTAGHGKATRIGAWKQALFRAALVPVQRTALQGMSVHSSAPQSNADRSLATGSFPGRFGPKEAPLTEKHRTAPHRTAEQNNSRQRISKQRGSPTGNSGFSGPLWLTRPGFLGRFINGLTTEKTTWP